MNKITQTFKKLLRGDRIFILIFILFDLFLIIVARRYFQSLVDLTSQTTIKNPTEQERQAIQELETLATTRSWKTLEDARFEQASHYLQLNLKPSPGNALYFYPETLPDKSLEKEFAYGQLKPGIEGLRKAYQNKKEQEASQAYRKLKSRVENYELGISANPDDLSDEAKRFLKLYEEFTKLSP